MTSVAGGAGDPGKEPRGWGGHSQPREGARGLLRAQEGGQGVTQGPGRGQGGGQGATQGPGRGGREGGSGLVRAQAGRYVMNSQYR